MIHGVYTNAFGEQFEFDIEDGVITHSDLGDDYNTFMEELEAPFIQKNNLF